MPTNRSLSTIVLALFFSAGQLALYAQAPQQTVDPKLTVDRIFASSEFQPERFGGFRWLKDGDSYAKFEPSEKVKGAFDLVRYGIESNKRDVLLSADKLIPTGETKPLQLHGYDWSSDAKRVLIYTNSQKVWRQKHARRLLAARYGERQAHEAWRRCEARDAHVRQVLA